MSFRKLDADGQSLLPDRLLLIRQKLVKDAKMENSQCDILSNFQTLCE